MKLKFDDSPEKCFLDIILMITLVDKIVICP